MMATDNGRPAQRIVILGALSAIAEAAARCWAEKGCSVLLAARDADRLAAVAGDLTIRGAARVETWCGDLTSVDAADVLPQMVERLGGVDVVLLAYGVLGDQTLAETDGARAVEILRVNFTSAAGWCLAAADLIEKSRGGTLIVIGSVAGDRGRASNYIYGASKSGLATLVQGLAHRLSRVGAHAVLIKPGFVDTPMTAGIHKKGLLWAQPEAIALAIVRAARPGGRPGPVVYAPSFWRWIMLAIRATPSMIFHKTRL